MLKLNENVLKFCFNKKYILDKKIKSENNLHENHETVLNPGK